ncbi:MAG: hypothetical protein LC667_14105 [Thioalkalivibrio sp.]|nr:hypothetical protein [Thioalkalivibrio sp.]
MNQSLLSPERTREQARGPQCRGNSSLARLKDDAVTLTFKWVEELISGRLPAFAHRHCAWWSNTETHSKAITWISEGWFVQEADLDEGKVNFRRA